MEPFEYAAILHVRALTLRRPPTREELALLLYLFSEWGRRQKRRGLPGQSFPSRADRR